MNLKDLQALGEQPASAQEQAEADRLAELLERLERGELASDVMSGDLSAVYSTVAPLRCEVGLLRESEPRSGPWLPDPFPDEFRIIRRLGEGAFGEVWLAEDLNLHRPVALKTLALADSAGEVRTKLEALRNEAGILAQLSHPNVVGVHAWRQSGTDHYLVLQLVPGCSLDRRLQEEGPLPWHKAARYVADVGEGLLEVHRLRLVHRDVKPANILWHAQRDEAILTDFGVSAHLGGPGNVAGSPLYMAPEAFEGQVSALLDVYALTATLFHLATGEPPFPAATVEELGRLCVLGLPKEDLRCQVMPEALEWLIRAGLSADPTRRPGLAQFVGTLRSTLNHLLADALPRPGGGVGLRLAVSVELEAGRWRPVAATQEVRTTEVATRGRLHKGTRPAERARLRCGDWLRIEVSAERDGYVTVFNVDAEGDLDLLYPDADAVEEVPLRAGVPLCAAEAQIQPPAGQLRLFAVWARAPLALGAEQLRGMAEAGPYQATRSMERFREALAGRGAEEARVVVLDLEHGD
jgi:hypothetical protein